MRRLRLLVRAMFGFSRMETNAFLLFIPLLFILLFGGTIYRKYAWSEPFPSLDRTDSLLAWLESHQRRVDSLPPVEFHPFDPNRASESEWITLRLKSSIVKRILNYRSKGGAFKKPEDVLRIYGMDSAWYAQAKPWMKFAARPESKIAARQKQQRPVADINEADTSALMDVFGIGPVLAKRIVTFRERLGGFVKMNQVREVYGLDSLVVIRLCQRFSVMPDFHPRQLAIHSASYDQLSGHPYIDRRQARAIITFVEQRGKLDSLGQLAQIRSLDAKWLEKIRPYLSLENDN